MTMKQYESGRSMVEILGVLVIIGVLSIGGIMGYNYAIAKNKANEITSELNLRAIVLSQQQTQSPKPAETTLTMEMGNTMKFGNEVSAEVSVNPEYFEITVADVEKQACELILQDYTTSAWMIINGTLYENTPTVCDTDKNTMTFVYKNDLGEKRNCATKGFFNITSYKCECAGGTYFDNTAKDCVCPAGHIWSETERKCIESRCGDNEFESLDGGCVSCEDEETYQVASSQICNICPNRKMYSNAWCALDNCKSGISFPNSFGRCVLCTDTSESVYTYTAQPLCNDCPNRYTSKYYCVVKDKCSSGQFHGINSGGSSVCLACDTPTEILIGSGQDEVLCTNCKNRSVVQKKNGWIYCVKTTCNNNEFKGIDGKCYLCTEGAKVSVGENSGCESETCGRKIDAEGYCVLENCPTDTHTKLADGSCYDCSQEQAFKSTQAECETGCASTGRRWTSYGWCKLNTCREGITFPYAGESNSCYGCSDQYARLIGTAEWGHSYCQACNRLSSGIDGYCYPKNLCSVGSEFVQMTNGVQWSSPCTSCDYTEKVQMSGHEEHRKMCADCTTTPRFFAEDYCYRCDSSESPVVTTSEERASCTKCPNRQINADNQCVLVITEE